MNIAQFYETVILRDLFEYIFPSAILLSGFGIVLDSFFKKIGINFSVIDTTINGGLIALLLFLVISIPLGHILSGLSSISFRRKDKNVAVYVIRKNSWLGEQVCHTISHYLQIPEPQAKELLKDAQTTETLREMGRDLIQFKMPTLHREHIGRLSIISRLCANMAVALIGLLISMILSMIILWGDIQIIYQKAPLALVGVGIFVLIVIVALIAGFVSRAARLRYRMVQLTFQIWCVVFYLEQSSSNNIVYKAETSE